MRTADRYVRSLRELELVLYVDGERVADPTTHPRVRPAINAVAATYALAHDPRHRELATAHSDLVRAPVNRFTHLFTQPQDLVRKLELQRVLGRLTGTCFQRCVGMDGINALFVATWEAGGDAHARFVAWLEQVQRSDDVINGAMTDPKGDRSKRPGEQPEQYLRVVERRPEGVVLRGAKIHQTGAANAHQILVMPGMAMRPGEEDFAIAAALPVDAPGVTMVLGRQPSDERKGGPDAGNARYSGQEVVVLFDDVFVPWERVFLDGQLGPCATLLETFAGYHRASYGGCKPGNLDVLIGAASLLTRLHGVERASHVRDKLVEMAHLTETVHGLGLGASSKSTQHGSGVWQVDPVLANVCKHNVTRLPYEIVRLAEDLAGGLMATMPSLADLRHPVIGEALRTVVGSDERALALRLVESMSYGAGSVPLRIECMHGAGSPQAQRIVLERAVDWEAKVRAARRLAGLPPREGEPIEDRRVDAEIDDAGQ
ncbi:4-hydroxyphenylacetate 3-hydroxylase N-terminal domain-containing protein [Paraliomyxa miuraensis]|uniref:4-hydroxyphenylacetate 3-hydroxylase N-terminal domain-containing protein n=1 Tax=Paraliomyxa miuraensis TaxID=376150 RepID=UPI002252EFD7|nr:4-hydroxyphenylacetate 3-hydroxylase N-terminal domain-containing protein [Paraliomyxa miuraensis]MCX4242247.1 4-hydroxybutyryl-CoA dehydratase [Paraliomyxa miuraensis]